MKRPTKPPQSVRLYTRITPELYTLLQQVRVARRIEDDAALVREALRRYLDEQAEQVGSKRHFNTTFQRRIAHLEWLLHVLLFLVAQSMTFLIAHATGQKLTSDTLIEQAIRATQQHHQSLNVRLETSRSQVEAETKRR